MIYIFHGEDISKSRQQLLALTEKLPSDTIIKLEIKDITPEKFTNYLDTPSLFSSEKNFIISNYFSLHPATQKKISPLINKVQNTNFYLWQDKNLTASNLSLFPQAKVNTFPLPKLLFVCLNSIKPGNFKYFENVYSKLIEQEPFELFLHILKGHLRKLFVKYSPFDINKLLHTYINLIDLEYKIKSGQINFPKEYALELIIKELTL